MKRTYGTLKQIISVLEETLKIETDIENIKQYL